MNETDYLNRVLMTIEGFTPSISYEQKELLQGFFRFLSSYMPNLWEVKNNYDDMSKIIQYQPDKKVHSLKGILYYPSFNLVDIDGAYVILYYPEKEVTSEDGGTHIIKDTYILIQIRLLNERKTFRFSRIKIKRGKGTLQELQRGYLFSHASSTSFNTFFKDESSLCFGSGDFSLIESMVSGGTTSLDFYKAFIVGLDRYLSWESITGGPYKKINDIPKSGNVGNRVPPRKTSLSQLQPSILTHLLNYLIKNRCIDIDTSGFLKINLTEEQDTLLAKSLIKQLNRDRELLGEYVSIFMDEEEFRYAITPDINTVYLPIFYFRDEIRQCEITNLNETYEHKPKLSTICKRYLEQTVTKIYYSSITTPRNQITNIWSNI